MENQNHQKNHLKVIFIPLFLALLIIVFFLIYNQTKTKKLESQSIGINTTNQLESLKKKPSPIKKTPIEKGVLSLKTENNQKEFSKDKLINLYVYASSDNQSIVGYDLVLNYDENTLAFQNQKSLLSDFQVFLKKEKNQLLITGIKNINSQTESIFSNTPLISISFKPKKSAKTQFSLLFEPEKKSDSNLINKDSKDILGLVEDLEIEIK